MLWFFRPARRGDPTRTYYVLNGVATFCFTLSFTVNLVYLATEVGLDPLQLVLVGTVLEITSGLRLGDDATSEPLGVMQ